MRNNYCLEKLWEPWMKSNSPPPLISFTCHPFLLMTSHAIVSHGFILVTSEKELGWLEWKVKVTSVQNYATEADHFLGDFDHFPWKCHSQCHMEVQKGPNRTESPTLLSRPQVTPTLSLASKKFWAPNASTCCKTRWKEIIASGFVCSDSFLVLIIYTWMLGPKNGHIWACMMKSNYYWGHWVKISPKPIWLWSGKEWNRHD